MSFLKMVPLEGAPKLSEFNLTYYWEAFLTEISDGIDMAQYAVPVIALKVGEDLSFLVNMIDKHMEVISEGKEKWLGKVKKVVGFRFLLSAFNESRAQQKNPLEVWINVASAELKMDLSEGIRHVWQFNQVRSELYIGRFAKGDRVELLDTNHTTRVRPARIQRVIGRRIFIRIVHEDCERDYLGEEDRQYDGDYWIDEQSPLIFHVGWAALNAFEFFSNEKYRNHAEQIGDALRKGEEPNWMDIDIRPDAFEFLQGDSSGWKAGIQVELLDLLTKRFQKLKVGRVEKMLANGYMIMRLDGGCDEDCFPIHFSSRSLFPVGYAEANGIPLAIPDNEQNFSWDSYLAKNQTDPGCEDMFHSMILPDTMHLFKTGAKLEATDLWGNFGIYPATVVKTLGRLVMIHYDGWDDRHDVLVDARSTELFPLGYAEMNGYPLKYPTDENVDEVLQTAETEVEKFDQNEAANLKEPTQSVIANVIHSNMELDESAQSADADAYNDTQPTDEELQLQSLKTMKL